MENILNNFIESHQKAQTFDKDVILTILKSNNKNLITYSSKIDDDTLHFHNIETKPIRKYWQTWEEQIEQKPPPTHELSTIENKLAYGIKYISKCDHELKFILTGYPKLPITFSIKNTNIVATVLFNDMQYHLSGIYVHLPVVTLSKIRPNGISLIVQLSFDGDELSPFFPLYIDSKTEID